MTDEYMPEYRPVDGKALLAKLARVKWSFVIMAVLCFFWAVYMYVTAPQGGAGGLLPTPVEGPAGLVGLLPWCGIVGGLLGFVGTVVSRSPWALGWVEPLVSIVMLLAGLWGIYSIPELGTFGQTYTLAGVFLALYVAVIALELYRRNASYWYVEMLVAAAVLAISLAGGVNMASDAALVGFYSLAFFVAAWGFVYGALKLGGSDKGAEACETVVAAAE